MTSKTELTKKRITKADLNQLAQSLYSEEVYCEHIRSGNRGWYLYQGTQETFIGANAKEAFDYLQSQTSQIDTSALAEKAADLVPDAKPTTTPKVDDKVSTPEIENNSPSESQSQIHTVNRATAPKAPKAASVKHHPVTPVNQEEPDRPPVPAEEVLEVFIEKFPKTFFREPEKIRPIQKYIHKKIRRLLGYQYTKEEISAALSLYTQTREYCQTLILDGQQRVDLEGNPCGEVSEEHKKDAQARLAGKKTMRPPKKKKLPTEPLPLPPIDQLITGKMDLCVKISQLPADSKTLRNGWEEFIIDTDGQMVKIVVRPRTWKKLQKSAKEYSSWIANIRGKMGSHTKIGFELLSPGIQIFEKTSKDSSEPPAESETEN